MKGPKWLRDVLTSHEDKIKKNRPVGTPRCMVTDGPDGKLILPVDQIGSGGGGLRLHVIELADAIPDPFKIASQLIDSIITTIDISGGSFVDDLVSMFIAALNSGTIPDRGDVLSLVNTYIGTPDVPTEQIPDLLDGILGGMSSTIAATLQTYFATAKHPSNGDYIYTEAAGIIYTIFRQVDGIPSANSVWRVPFTIGEGDAAVTYVALTTSPAPDVAALATSVGMALAHLLSAMVDLLANLITDALLSLFEAFALIKPLIESLVDALRTEIMALINAINTALTALTGRVGDIEDILDAAVEVDVIDTAGHAATIKVLTSSDGGAVYRTITWIDSSTGTGQSADFIFWNGPNTNLQDVDWRTFHWLGQDGSHKAAKLLSLNTGGYPKNEDDSPGPLFSPVTKDLCSDDGSSETKQLLIADEP